MFGGVLFYILEKGKMLGLRVGESFCKCSRINKQVCFCDGIFKGVGF